MRKLLAFAAVVESGTGFVLVVAPTTAVALLAGPTGLDEATPLGRILGIALLALGLACWPGRQSGGSASAAFRAMLTYNALVAAYLLYLGVAGYFKGALLWPAVVLHALVALLMVWTWHDERR
jgi:hypothetical protein